MIIKETTMKKETNDHKGIGLDVPMPKRTCDDLHCPFHGTLPVRGNVFVGTVVSAKVPKTVIVSWERKVFVKKYERYTRKRTKVKAHCPSCIDVAVGDEVKIAECRPISKTKHFVVVEVIKVEN